MNVITIESDAFQQIMNKLDEVSVKMNKHTSPLTEVWLDISETCQLLKISKRTLQNYRSQNILPYSQIDGKIYFSANDIDQHLKKHYKPIKNK